MPETKANPLDKARYTVLKPFAGQDIVEPTMKSRLTDAAKMMAVGAIGETLARIVARKGLPIRGQVIVKRLLRPEIGLRQAAREGVRYFAPMSMAQNLAVSGIYGAFERDIRNALVRASKDPSKKQEALDQIKRLGEERKRIRSIFMPDMEKEAFWGGLARGTGTLAKTFGAGLAMNLGKPGTRIASRMLGRDPSKPLGIATRAFGLGTLAGTGYGAYRGGKWAYRKYNQTHAPVQRTYTAMLRNNLLAGNIRPEELGPEDMASVQRLGMK